MRFPHTISPAREAASLLSPPKPFCLQSSKKLLEKVRWAVLIRSRRGRGVGAFSSTDPLQGLGCTAPLWVSVSLSIRSEATAPNTQGCSKGLMKVCVQYARHTVVAQETLLLWTRLAYEPGNWLVESLVGIDLNHSGNISLQDPPKWRTAACL